MDISEDNGETLEAITIRFSRKQLRRLKEVATYNVAKHLKCDDNVDFLTIQTFSKNKSDIFFIYFHYI